VRLARVGVEGDEHLGAGGVRVADAGADLVHAEIEAGEVARVGGVAKAEVHGIRAVIHGRLERRQTAGRTDQFHVMFISQPQMNTEKYRQ